MAQWTEWTEAEDELLRQSLKSGNSYGDVAAKLGRSYAAVASRARMLRKQKAHNVVAPVNGKQSEETVVDVELTAMKELLVALSPLDRAARARVLNWVVARFQGQE
jgi:cyanate lyase